MSTRAATGNTPLIWNSDSSLECLKQIAQESVETHKLYAEHSIEAVAEIAWVIANALHNGASIYLFGNGGSAADAQHVAGELVGRFLKESDPWPAIALTTDSSVLTCIGNDWDYEDVFARQVRAHVRPGDIVVGITTSGTSPNVIRALKDASTREGITIGFTGIKGKSLQDVTDYCYVAPVEHTPRVQELHLLAWHSICELVESALMSSKPNAE
ncbi:MAG: SIS domain-containing protein [Chthonomonadales bacterium]